ncbi:hypothetical protein V3C99_004907 [Haemonchus contortus]
MPIDGPPLRACLPIRRVPVLNQNRLWKSPTRVPALMQSNNYRVVIGRPKFPSRPLFLLIATFATSVSVGVFTATRVAQCIEGYCIRSLSSSSDSD